MTVANSHAELRCFSDLVNIKPKVMSCDLIWIQRSAFRLRSVPLNKSTWMCSESFTFDSSPGSRKQKIHSSPLVKVMLPNGHRLSLLVWTSCSPQQFMDYSHCVRYRLRTSAPHALQNHFANGKHRVGSELQEKKRESYFIGSSR